MDWKTELTNLGWRFLRKCQACGGSKEYWVKGGITISVRPYRKTFAYGSKIHTFDDFNKLP